MTSNWKDGLNVTILTNGPISVTKDVLGLPLYTDAGTQEVNQAIIVLEALNGKYITSAPIIDEFFQFEIAHTDEFGFIYRRRFEVRKIVPVFNKQEGTKLELQLTDLGWHFQNMNYIKPHRFTSAFTVAKDLGDYYNVNKASGQPIITGHDDKTKNELPDWTANNYEFQLNEDKCWNRLNEVIDKLGGSADAGGILDFFEFRFDTDGPQGEMSMRVFSSGSKPDNPITIADANTVNVGEEEAGIDSTEGNFVGAWGDPEVGTWPMNFVRYSSLEEAFQLYPEWDAVGDYKIGFRVRRIGLVYEAKRDSVNFDPAFDFTQLAWIEKDSAAIYGNQVTYSPLTKSLSNEWRQSAANMENIVDEPNGQFGQSFLDANSIIWDDAPDEEFYRTKVDIKAKTNQFGSASAGLVPVDYAYTSVGGGGETHYRGFRILVSTNEGAWTITGAFSQNSGKDSNGRPFLNSVVAHNGNRFSGSSQWRNWDVIFEAAENMQVIDRHRGIMLQFNDSTSQFENVGFNRRGNDALHPWSVLRNDGGILATQSGDTGFTKNQNSAIRIEYHFTPIPFFPDIPLLDGAVKNANFYRIGMWANFEVPFPRANFFSGFSVGSIIGGGDNTNDPREPTTIDTENMHLTRFGNRGFTFGEESEEYGPLSAFTFFIKLQFKDPFAALFPIGNYKMRVIFEDLNDNSLFTDFVVERDGLWTAITIPLSGMEIYRGRHPFETAAVLQSVIKPKVLSPVNQFLWRNLKRICIQYQDSYDDEGRYRPELSEINQKAIAALFVGDAEFIMLLDGVRFKKPLLALSKLDQTLDSGLQMQIEPDFIQRPTIINQVQLTNDAEAEKEKKKHRRKEFVITTSGRYDIKFGESFFLENANIIKEADRGADANGDGGDPGTIKLVAHRIEYSITRPEPGSSGGFLRVVSGVKRFI